MAKPSRYEIEQILRKNSFIEGDDAHGKRLTEQGMTALAISLEILPEYHKGRWGEVFVPLMSKCVPSCVELIIIRDHKCLLLWRDDPYFKGWHTPGTYIGPRETWQQTVERCAAGEIKRPIRFIKRIGGVSNYDNVRFHDVSNLLLCEISGEPEHGKWFSTCPPDIIPEHVKYWPIIEEYLKMHSDHITPQKR